MKKYFAYIRVSTVKQGEHGSSLQEQQSAIEAYACRQGLNIVAWYQETETAAKQGRRVFSRMLAGLERGDAQGVIIHKIDRGARNLRDWANLGDLIDRGIDVQFAHDNLDMRSRGGRLSADIQAVVAADYIRNLRDEVKKGFYGRLKQGLYPLGAPYGYLDRGKGKPKEIDPVRGPLVRHTFERYAQGDIGLHALLAEMHKVGLMSRRGKPLHINTLTGILHNPFYIGLIRINRTGEVFQGIHQPLITKALFDRVQAVLQGKTAKKSKRHDFLFRRLIRCCHCGYRLTGELIKGRYIYYRCHTYGCVGASVREVDLNEGFRELIELLRCEDGEIRDIRDMIEEIRAHSADDIEEQKVTIKLQLAKGEELLHRLTDAYLEGTIEKEVFASRKTALLSERRDRLDRLEGPPAALTTADKVSRYFELETTAYLRYGSEFPSERRAVMEYFGSNFSACGKTLAITLKSPFQEIVNWRRTLAGGGLGDDLRTPAENIFKIIKDYVTEHPFEEVRIPPVLRKRNSGQENIEKFNRKRDVAILKRMLEEEKRSKPANDNEQAQSI